MREYWKISILVQYGKNLLGDAIININYCMFQRIKEYI